MRILVISDTHSYSLEDLSKKLLDEFTGADSIVHAGDYTSKNLVDELKKMGDFRGVHGNMDPYDIVKRLPSTEVFDVGDFRIGVIHPSEGGSPFGIEKRIKVRFEKVDAIIYGHTHKAENREKDGILYFNPGTATGAFPALKKTYGILRINEKVKGEVVKV